MAEPSNFQPAGWHTVTPRIIVHGAEKLVEFVKHVFGATGQYHSQAPAELQLGDSIIMMADEFPEFGSLAPQSTGGSGTGLHIYIEDVDSAFDRAVKAGATVEMPVADMFWGDRYGKLRDPFGHKWSIGTHKADLSMEEMKKGMDEAMAKMPKSA